MAEAGKLKMGKKKLEEQKAVLAKVNELHEANPMLGLRGVRLGIVKPGLYAMQVQAIVEAAVKLKKKGKDPRPEIMIPLVATAEELRQMREELEPVVRAILEKEKVDLHIEIGTMIELPTACISADEIGEHADFFSFGTNDLTQTAFGFSRDDIGKFLTMYEERKLVPYNPFVTIHPAVARLMEIAVEGGRRRRTPNCTSASAESTEATRIRWRHARSSVSTTSRARPSGCRRQDGPLPKPFWEKQPQARSR